MGRKAEPIWIVGGAAGVATVLVLHGAGVNSPTAVGCAILAALVAMGFVVWVTSE